MTVQEGTPLFPLGRIVATPGALEVMVEADVEPAEFLTRHQRGDWGEVPSDDVRENERSLKYGWRIISSYTVGEAGKVWIITEADRSGTCILRPEEY